MTDNGERDPVSWPLGQRLEQARGPVSLEKVAEKAGLTRETVRYYELGYRADNGKPVKPRPRTLRAIAEAVGVPVPEAFELGGVDPKHLRPHELHMPDPDADLIAKVRHLDSETKEALGVIVDRVLRSRGWIAADAPVPGPGSGVEVRRGVAEPGHVGVESHSEFGTDAPGVPADQPNG